MMNSHVFWFRNNLGHRKSIKSQYIDPNCFVFKLLFTQELYLEKWLTLRTMLTIRRDRILRVNNCLKTHLIYKNKSNKDNVNPFELIIYKQKIST